jgi:hypothetical protein
MKNINLIFLWVFSNCFLFIQAQTIDTIFLKKSLGYNIQNSFVQFDKNTLEWYDKEAIYPFFEKLNWD